MVSCCREHDLLLFCDEMCKCASARSDCAAQSSRQADRPRNALQAAAHGHAACTAADRLLEYDAADRLPAICDAYELGISLGGMSKAYAMPGAPPPPPCPLLLFPCFTGSSSSPDLTLELARSLLDDSGIRVGWLCTRCEPVLARVQKLKQYTTICGGTPNELIARIALSNGDAIISRNLSILRGNLRLVENFFARHSERFQWVSPRVGTVSYPKLALDGDDAEAYCSSLAEQSNLLLVPPAAMAPHDVTSELNERVGPRFRLGFGRTTLPELLQQWDAAVVAEKAEAEAVSVVADARL
jgi:hypothetical protein